MNQRSNLINGDKKKKKNPRFLKPIFSLSLYRLITSRLGEAIRTVFSPFSYQSDVCRNTCIKSDFFNRSFCYFYKLSGPIVQDSTACGVMFYIFSNDWVFVLKFPLNLPRFCLRKHHLSYIR